MSSENQQTEQVASEQGVPEKVVEQVKQATEQAAAVVQDVAAKVTDAVQPAIETVKATANDVAEKATEIVQEVQQNGVAAAIPKITGEDNSEQQDTEMPSPPKDKESPSKVPAEEASAGQKRERPLSPLPPQTSAFPPPPMEVPAPASETAPVSADAPATSSSGQDAKKPKLDEEATKTEEAIKTTDADVLQVSEQQLAQEGGDATEAAKPGSRGKDSVTSADGEDKISTRTRSKASV